MTTGWQALEDELDRWASEGRTACFWWRDDDAVAATPAFERLIGLHRASAIPLALAIIPAQAEPGLAERLRREPGIAALQHGFTHQNHAEPGEKKSEFPKTRPINERLRDMQAGRSILTDLLDDLLPVFVPPWNRLAPDCLVAMHSLGFAAVSAFQSRGSYWAAAGLATLNTHIDPIDWHGNDNAAAVERSLAAACLHLRAMRAGEQDLQPLGLLTHHLRHDETIWAFAADFLTRTANHSAVRWLDVGAALKIGAPEGSAALP
ncbi:MAG: polysaccharide deacetylase family protein, partial [Ferrovibrio sp.]